MLDGQFNIQDREQMFQAKKNAFGVIQNDRTDALPEMEYLAIEIKETKEKRRSHSMPLFAVSAMVFIFSIAANTLLTQITGIMLGFCSLFGAIWIVYTHTQALGILQRKLASEMRSTTEDTEAKF